MPNISYLECRTCKEVKDVEEFYDTKSNLSGKMTECKECVKKRVRAYDEANKEKHLERAMKAQLKKRYSCTPEEYKERMATSDCCEICGKKEDLCYDHDHYTGKFRGVLCRQCNRSIGQLGDTPEALARAFIYLLERTEGG